MTYELSDCYWLAKERAEERLPLYLPLYEGEGWEDEKDSGPKKGAERGVCVVDLSVDLAVDPTVVDLSVPF